MSIKPQWNIGIIGTGFIGTGLRRTIQALEDMKVSAILTQRNLDQFPNENVHTHSIQELIAKSDLVVECNGNPVYATPILCDVMDAGIPVVTMDAELHVTSGSYLTTKGLITEAEGDQPGALASLNKRLVSVGFQPLVYGNLKGYLNLDPSPTEMVYWAEKQGISVEQVTGATDGTKVQIEQAFVANGLSATIAKRGLLGFESADLTQGSFKLAAAAKKIGRPISDYLLCSPNAEKKFPAGVFITAEYNQIEKDTLKYLKLGEGPFYTLVQNYHLVYLDIPLTIRQVLQGKGVLLDNGSKPIASVSTIAKKEFKAGTVIRRSNRHFMVRGEAVLIKDFPNHIPIGLMYGAVIKNKIEPGQMLQFHDVEIPPSKAYDAWQYVLNHRE